MNPVELDRLYKKIHNLYSKKPLNVTEVKNLVDIYDGYSFEEIDKAFSQYMKSKTYYPKPADLLKIADYNREMRQSQRLKENQAKFDSNGKQIFKCRYCKDTDYMLVDDNSGYGLLGHKCLHTHPIKSEEYKRNGKVKIITKGTNGEKIKHYYKFNDKKGVFVIYENATKEQQKERKLF